MPFPFALAGILVFLPQSETKERRFDFFGFAMLATAIGALQLMLDRGQAVDWFSSAEIWIYLGLAVSGHWAFVIHCWTARNPFMDLRLFRDRNFTMGLVFIFIVGLTMFWWLALLPPLLQSLMGYPVIETGIVMAPRGVGTMVSMILVGRLVARFDARLLVCFGLGVTAWSLWMMSGFNLQMDSQLIILSGVIQGFGLGFVFVPLSTLTFATIASQFRADATSFFSLVRNVGSGVGILIVTAVLARMIAVNHEEIASRLTATSPQVRIQMPSLLSGSPAVAARVSGLVSQQAAIISYIDNFLLMLVFTLAAFLIVLLLRKPKGAGPGEGHATTAATAD